MKEIEIEREERAESKSVKTKTKKTAYSLLSNMLVAFLITFAASVESLDKSLPENLQSLFSNLIVVVCFLTWVGISFISGCRKKWGFAFFSVIVWILPQVIIFLANDGPRFFRMSLIMYALSEFSGVFSTALLEKMLGWLSGNAAVCAGIMTAVCVLFWLGGFFAKKIKN